MRFFLLFHLFAVLSTAALFIHSFFPMKKASRGFATQKVKIIDAGDSSNGPNSTNSPSYRRLVLMVIDALRADFAFGPFNYLPKTYETIRSGQGLQFVAKTNPPTVTLPRIKAITTGSPPSFVDVAFNFGSPALEEDNIVTQMKRSGRQIVFFGDDTWINLFPEHFERSDGTTSFFVSDYTEVDANVTRHLKSELSSPTWDVMILHYLGLDHIGHTAGPSSPLVRPKLVEMDNVIRQIYNAMEEWEEPSLMVVCGDHGMSDQGGHGGASAGEVSVPVLFLSPHIASKDTKHVEPISQADLCPTLSVLLGLPIPKNNLGKVVIEALTGFTLPQKVSVIHQNALQAMQILKGYVQDLEKESSHLLYTKAKQQFHTWLQARSSTPAPAWHDEGHSLLIMYSESLTLLAEKVTRLSTEYDVYAMAVSIALLWMLLVSLILSHIKKNLTTFPDLVSRYTSQLIIAISTAVLSHITMCTGGVPSDMLCQASFLSIGIQLFVGVVFVVCLLILLTDVPKCVSSAKPFQAWVAQMSFIEVFLLAGTAVHTFMLLSTSFVEEEHQIFYFLTTSVHLLLLAQSVILLLEGHRGKHQWNVSKNPAIVGCKKHAEINSSGEKCLNSIGGGEVCEKAAVTDKCENMQGSCLNPSGDSPCNDTVEFEIASGSLKPCSSKRKETENTLQTAGGCVKVKEANLKESGECISLTEFGHVSASIVCVLVFLRVLRRWNQTGNKWLDVPDFGDWLILPANKMYLSLAVIFSMMIIGSSQGRQLKRVQSMSINLALATAYMSRVAAGSLFFPTTFFLSQRGITEARASFFFIGITLILSILPTNCFRLEPETPKRNLRKSLPSIEDNTAQAKRAGYVPILTPLTETLQNKSGEKNQVIGQNERKESYPEHFQTSSSVTVKHKLPHPASKSKLGSSSVPSQMEESEKPIFSMHQRLSGVTGAFLCFMCLVQRPHNTPVVTLMSLVEQMMTPVLISSRMRPSYILLYCLWMGQAFFFFQGNSNSLSTLDLTTGYSGQYEFTPAVTGTLLCLATYAGVIFWILTYLRIVCVMCNTDKKHPGNSLPAVLTRSCGTLLLSRAWPLSLYTALVSTQRYHLFVWTVFSPKLLYEGANTFVTYVLASLLLVYSLFTR